MRLTEQQAAKLGIKKPKRTPKNQDLITSLSHANDPQKILFQACKKRWGDTCVDELEHAIPGRKFRLDIAFPEQLLCLEVDGWQWHGRFLADFQRDREKQNLLTLYGWRILRFTNKDIKTDLEGALDLIHATLNQQKKGSP